MVFWVIVQLVIAVAFLVISFALTPKAKKQKPAATQQQDEPTSEAGRPVPVVFGTITIKESNVLWTANRSRRQREVKA